MKIAFDEHIPAGLVHVFDGLAKQGVISKVTVVSARSYKPPKERGDVGWIGRFAQDGGRVIISGDRNMRSNVHERAALAEAGMITFFFQAAWSNRSGFVKSAMLLNWWPKIQEYLGKSKPGDCWEIPFQWEWKDLRDVGTLPSNVEVLRPKKPGRRARSSGS